MAADFFKLHGQVSQGMFPNEVAFVVTDHEGHQLVAIVPKDSVDAEGRIRVRLVERANGLSLVKVPGELINANSGVFVADSELQPA